MSPEDAANKPKEALLTDTFEMAWKKLPEILTTLPLREQLKYKLQMTEHSRMSLLQPWDQVLENYIPEMQRQAKENTIPSHSLTESEARVAIMTNPLPTIPLYMSVLHDHGEIERFNYGKAVANESCISFLQTLDALKSTLPTNRYGSNRITPHTITVETVNEALKFISNL
jgi:hypothetical protein